jgi:hypothetical protein
VDTELDDADHEAGRPIACPVLVTWAGRGGLPLCYGDLLEAWRPWAPDIRGGAVDASHFVADDRPEETSAELLASYLPGRQRTSSRLTGGGAFERRGAWRAAAPTD